jgi:predicted acylesterase/phospholipase RssA
MDANRSLVRLPLLSLVALLFHSWGTASSFPCSPLQSDRTSNARTKLLEYRYQNLRRQWLACSLFPVAVDGVPYDNKPSAPLIVFPGGGIFFYWQAGAVTFLRERGYDLHLTTMVGASAGALTATLAVTNVDFYEATRLALSMADDAGVWNRSGGLQGIWGPLICDWLDELLPDDAAERANHRLTLLLTPVPSFGKERITMFRDRQDLIRCNAASVQIPWFLDSKLTANFRDRPYIDGSFLAQSNDYVTKKSSSNVLVLDYNQDPLYQSTSFLSFIEAVNPDGIYKILEDGKRYASGLEERGMLSMLPKVGLPP